MDQTKSIELQKKRLVRKKGLGLGLQVHVLLCMIKVVQLKSMENVLN